MANLWRDLFASLTLRAAYGVAYANATAEPVGPFTRRLHQLKKPR